MRVTLARGTDEEAEENEGSRMYPMDVQSPAMTVKLLGDLTVKTMPGHL